MSEIAGQYITSPIITLVLTGPVVPKARPRHSNYRSYLPANYRDWKEQAIAQLRYQYSAEQPLPKAAISIQIHGSARGDLDNLAGAILDALVQSDILLDDRISCVPILEIVHIPDKYPGASIHLEAL